MSEHNKYQARARTKEKTEIIDKALHAGLSEVLKDETFTKDAFHKIKNKIYGTYKLAKPIPSIELIERYNELMATGEMEENLFFKKILRKR
jgi:hypothetical protein